MAKRIFNRADVKDLRRQLRRTPTKAEKLFWSKVRNGQVARCKFRRQYSVGKFVVDFYAPEVRLAIELDGAVHFLDDADVRDQAREALIAQHGVSFLRFTNYEIETNLSGVLEAVRLKIEELRQRT